MKSIEQIEAEIAALQAELEARKSEPDFSEARGAFETWLIDQTGLNPECLSEPPEWLAFSAGVAFASEALGPRVPEPTEAEDLAMAQEVVNRHWDDPRANDYGLAIAAFKAERKRAGGA
jgi:hypothetical protein